VTPSGEIPSAGLLSVGILHTVPGLVASFDSELVALEPQLEIVHIADASLLATAISEGVTDAVRRRVSLHIRHLADLGVGAVLVTCSSIGEAVEAAAGENSIPVLRVDAPMAERAARLAAEHEDGPGRIAVLATLQATLGPTGRLVERAIAERVGASSVEVSGAVVDGAAAARNRGDHAEHDSLIRAAVADAAETADVIVLAQASMAQAAESAAGSVPVLTSPAGGIHSLLSALHGGSEELR
jgi:glutamate racemase